MPRVSVVIPAFNCSAFIGAALRSAFAQTFDDFEVIVVDDGSDDHDRLADVLAAWAGRVRYIRQSNRGPGHARNTGIAHAAGSLVAFLDADDEWLPHKLATQVEYFERHPSAGLVHTGVVGDAATCPAGPPRHSFCELFHTEFFIRTLTVMVPKAVLEEVGGFEERREIHIEDWELWLRIAAAHPIGFIPEPLARYRPGGLMSRQLDRTYGAQALVIDKSRALCAQACAVHRDDPARCESRRRHVLHRDWGYDRLQAGDLLGARDQLRRALHFSPSDARTRLLHASTFLGARWQKTLRKLAGLRRGRLSDAGPDDALPAHRPQAVPSLVHDTVFRQIRRRTIASLHGVDERLWKTRRSVRRILFDAASPMSFAVFKPVYERLRRDPRLEVWFTASDQTWPPHAIFGETGLDGHVVSPSCAAWMKVDAYVNADFWDMTWLNRRTRRVHLFHGVAGKYGLDAPVDLAPTIAAFDCLMFVNADRRNRYIAAGLVPNDDLKAAIVGFPKVDCLVDGSLDRAEIMRALAFDAAVPTIIYAPTWSPHSSLNLMGEEIVGRIAAEGMQVIVKLHDRSYDRRERGSGGIDWAGRLARYDSHPMVRVVREADGSPFLMAADAMISDHSSIAFEYMLLDRPIVLIDCPALVTHAAIGHDKVRRLRSAADVIAEASTLPAAIASALRDPGRLSVNRRRVASELFYQPGTATDRAVALMYRIVGLPALENAGMPVPPEPLAAAS